MLRVLAGGALIDRGLAAINAEGHTGPAAAQIAGAAVGLMILAGLWTPAVGILAGIIEAWIGFTQPGAHSFAIMLAGLGISLAMIGPGAWSIDAHLYGRKQILPPES